MSDAVKWLLQLPAVLGAMNLTEKAKYNYTCMYMFTTKPGSQKKEMDAAEVVTLYLWQKWTVNNTL